jgi:translocation and assembly module TamB
LNALPHIFDYDQPPDEPPKKPRWTWKRIVGWIVAAIVILLLLIALGIMVLLHSSRFHAYVLKTAQEKATAALGTPFQLKDYKLQFNGYNIKLDLYGMVVHGAQPYPAPPLLTVDHITGSAHITSLLHRTWYITDINIDHPVARVFVDKAGKNNLPTMKPSSSSANQTNIFDMGIRHALLSNGEVYFNDHKSALDADLHELSFSSGFDVSKKMYAGTMSYRNGHLRFGTFAPMPHDLDARFSADPNTFELPSAVLRSGNSQFSLTATVHDYNSPQVQANYRATLDVTELRRIMKNATLPMGVVNTEGVLQYHAEPNRTMLDTMVVRGKLSSPALAVHTANARLNISNLGAQYDFAMGNAEVKNIHAGVMGGELAGNLSMRNVMGDAHSHLTAALKNVRASSLKQMLNSPQLQKVALNGTANADVDASWGKTFNDLTAKANAALDASMAPQATPAQSVPLTASLHARYSAPSSTITLADSFVRLPATSLTLNGTVSNRSALQVRLQSNDLHQLEAIADIFRSAPPGAGSPQPLGLYGIASFNGTVRGTISAPELAGNLNAQDLRVHGTAWRSLRTNIT